MKMQVNKQPNLLKKKKLNSCLSVCMLRMRSMVSSTSCNKKVNISTLCTTTRADKKKVPFCRSLALFFSPLLITYNDNNLYSTPSLFVSAPMSRMRQTKMFKKKKTRKKKEKGSSREEKRVNMMIFPLRTKEMTKKK